MVPVQPRRAGAAEDEDRDQDPLGDRAARRGLRDERRLDGFLEPVGLSGQVQRLVTDVFRALSSVTAAIGAVSRCVSSKG